MSYFGLQYSSEIYEIHSDIGVNTINNLIITLISIYNLKCSVNEINSSKRL